MTDKFDAAFMLLWSSTNAFRQRFDMDKTATPLAQMRCIHEELAEFECEFYQYHCKRSIFHSRDHAAKEAADLMVTIMGALMSMGVTLHDIEAAMLEIARKNDAKTSETHAMDSNGKVSRKVAQS